MSYAFSIVMWRKIDLKGIQRRTSTIFIKLRAHDPKAAVERLTLPRQMGGLALAGFNNSYKLKLSLGWIDYKLKGTLYHHYFL